MIWRIIEAAVVSASFTAHLWILGLVIEAILTTAPTRDEPQESTQWTDDDDSAHGATIRRRTRRG